MTISWNDVFAMAPQAILVLGGIGVLVSQMILSAGRTRVAWQLTVLTLVLTILVTTLGLSNPEGTKTFLPRAFIGYEKVQALNGSYSYSSFNANAIVLFAGLALCAVLFMRKSLEKLNLDFAENYFLILMSIAGYAYAVCAEDLVTLFIGIELGSLPTLILVGLNRESKASNEAALKYLLLSAFSMAFLLLGIALLYGSSATMKLRELKEIGPHFTRTRVVTLGYIFVFSGFFFKLAAFPLHSYVADVYEGATTVFTGLIASLSKVAAVLVLLKINLAVHDGYRQYLAPVLTSVAIGSLLFGAFASVYAGNIKRILAYSSISHAGFMLCFFIVPAGTDSAIMGAIKQDGGSALFIYAMGYATAALLAFGTLAYAENTATDRVLTLDNLAGLGQRDKWAAWALALSLLSFMGMPPLAGFFGKFFVFKYLAVSNNLAVAAAAGASGAISVYAYIRIIRPLFFSDTPSEATPPTGVFAGGEGARVSVVILIAALGFFAVFASFLYNNGIPAIQKIY
ncbi:MAG: hypothetical protein J0L53_09265 [Spirochaetes bacterium]|nr:hypothetical protein [Spirochaetota bacterium]MBX3720306.1 hypothetical protein [Turneriella sp.]